MPHKDTSEAINQAITPTLNKYVQTAFITDLWIDR